MRACKSNLCQKVSILQMCHKCLIENFWSILKRKVYFDGWKAETNEVLIERTKKCLKIPLNVCQRLMRGLKTKVRKAADNGVLSVIN
jgi:hypothetical protein